MKKIKYITIALPEEIFQKWDLDITNFSEELCNTLSYTACILPLPHPSSLFFLVQLD